MCEQSCYRNAHSSHPTLKRETDGQWSVQGQSTFYKNNFRLIHSEVAIKCCFLHFFFAKHLERCYCNVIVTIIWILKMIWHFRVSILMFVFLSQILLHITFRKKIWRQTAPKNGNSRFLFKKKEFIFRQIIMIRTKVSNYPESVKVRRPLGSRNLYYIHAFSPIYSHFLIFLHRVSPKGRSIAGGEIDLPPHN